MATNQESMARDMKDTKAEQKSMSVRQDTMETEQKSVSARQDTMETEQKSISARQDTMQTEQKSMSARQDTMETEQKSMSAMQDTMEAEQKSMSARQDTMETEQKTMSARLDTVESQQKTMSANQESMTKEIHAYLKPMIETTMNRIRTEKGKQFVETKAFQDAQAKLRVNRVLVIKGNTGDGKTSTAFQLLHSLTEEQQCRKPLQLHKIKKLDSLAPNSNLVCIIDNIFGQKDISKSDEGEWNKRLKDVETLFVDKQNQTNILLITIRNEIFNALTEHSLGTVFTEENIVDLSSDKYQIKEEKQKLLAIYKPEKFSWDEKEITKILGCKLHIGFPQCCYLFCKSDELQKRRTVFFESPVKYFKDALSKLSECYAILFLFLNDGEIKVNDLDPNGDKVDKTLLEQAFNIELVGSENHINLENEKKQIGFVRKSLNNLLDFLVRKEKHWWSREEVYRFHHDSIYDTVAQLYGNNTPVGYIKHCPRKALHYLTTVETSTDMVVISSGHYNDLCERLLREFESVERYDYDIVIGSLDVWNVRVFVEIFDKYLNEKKVNKVDILNKACLSGLVKLALYLLEKDVKPDKDTMLCVVEGGSVDMYNTARQYGVTPTGRDEYDKNVLHLACVFERESISADLCQDYPNLVHGTDMSGLTPLHVAAGIENCSMFQRVEKTVLKCLCRVEDEQHRCQIVNGCLVHRDCACSQYMCQLVDHGGRTVLHWSCAFGRWGHKDLCVYLCRSYPAMTACRDSDGCHCLHYIARYTTDVDWFIECERYVRKHMETVKQNYDIKTILDGRGKSVLDYVKEAFREIKNIPLYDHLLGVFSE